MKLLDLFYNSHIHKVLSADLSTGMPNHSYLLVSNDDMLIHAYARFAASMFNCVGGIKPCGKCNTCTRIEHGNFSDIIEYPNGKDSIVTEDINNIVLDELKLPYEADKKIYILYDFDNATVQAQNKLLKTLEEPSKSTIFILTASNVNNVLPTIRSRSKKIVEGALEDDVIKQYLIEEGVSEDTAKLISSASFGNLTYACAHANNSSGKQIIMLTKDIFNNMLNSSMVLKYSTLMLNYKDDITDVISQMLCCVADMAKLIATGKVSREYNLQLYNINSLNGIAKLCENAQKKINANCNINSVIDGLLLGILEERYKWQM